MAIGTHGPDDNQPNSTDKSLTFQAHGENRIELPSTSLIADATLTRDGNDLILRAPDGQTVVIEGYFSAEPAPLLQSADGSTLTPNLVEAFARSPMEFAAGESANDESPVGAVEEVTGKATVTRADGTVETITSGTPVYQGDIIETDADGAVNIVFLDETSMAVSQNARLAVDEYTFDPATESGKTDLSVLRGLFVFTSGLIGRDDPDDVNIDTPVGSIGIRGTIIAGEIVPGGDSNISVLEGAIVVRNGAMEVTLSEQFETVQLSSFDQPMRDMGTVPASDINTKFNSIGDVLPSLFSVINETVQEQAPQPVEQKQAPQEETAPQDADTTNAEPVQEPVSSDTAPLTSQDIVTLSGDEGLPRLQTTSLQTQPVLNQTTLTAPLVGTGTTAPRLTTTTTTTTNDLPPPSVIQSGKETVFGIVYTASTLLDTADAGATVGTVSSTIAGDVVYTFANGTTISDNGYFMLYKNTATGVTTVRLTTDGANHLHSSLDTLQLGGFNIVARNADGREATGAITPQVQDANTNTLNLANASSVGVTHITDDYVNGSSQGNNVGHSIAALGDINNDGFDDFIFSNNSPTAGQNHIYIGHGQTGSLPDGLLGGASVVANPWSTQANLNSIVAGIGDFNGDGIEDYAIGQSGGMLNSIQSGNAYIVNGANSTTYATFLGTASSGDSLGSSISGIGDINNDGFADVVIGAPGINGGDGAMYVALGGASPWSAGISVNSSTTYTILINGDTLSGMGTSVRGIGDFNGDGFNDIAVGSPGANSGKGSVTIHYGREDFGYIPSVETINGVTSETGFGSEIISLGDINGDGMSDIMVADGSSNARIILGGGAGQTSADLNGAGYELNGMGGIGDFNGDGHDDFVVSMANTDHSKLYVVYGKDGGAPILNFDYLKDPHNAFEMIYNGATINDGMLEISGVGDINGDGRADFGIGVPDLNGTAGGDGGVILVYGRDSTGKTTNISTRSDAITNGESLVGSTASDILSIRNINDGSISAGNGNDIINVSGNGFRSIDGGNGLDTLRVHGSLDFSNINFEQVSGIEQLQFGAANQTMTLTLENIFNLLKTSDSYFDGGTNHSGYLKISSGALTGGKLVIDAGLTTDIIDATADDIDTQALEKYAGAGNVTSTDVAGDAAGTYDTFKIGGYTLLIENNIQVDIQ